MTLATMFEAKHADNYASYRFDQKLRLTTEKHLGLGEENPKK